MRLSKNPINLKEKKWLQFTLDEIFEIKPGVRLTAADMIKGGTPFIGASDSNNGVTNFVSNINGSKDSNVLGINYNGSVGEAFYHPYECIFSDDVKRLTFKEIQGNKYLYLFFKTLILRQKSKYAYGYKFNEQRMRRQKIMVPVDDHDKPDWLYIENFMKDLEVKTHPQVDLTKNEIHDHRELNEVEWGEFFVGELFNIQRGKRLVKHNQIDGDIPYISSTSINNGVDNFIGNKHGVRKFSSCITIANSGSVGKVFYHPYKFIASDHVTHLKNKNFNKYTYLFVATMLEKIGNKYSFNREISDTRLKREKIMLPIDSEGNPYLSFMEQYMKRMENSVIDQIVI